MAVRKVFSTGCRRVSSRGFRDQCRGLGDGEGREELTKSGIWGWHPHNLQSNKTCMLVSSIFKQLSGPSLLILIFWANFRNIGNLIFLRRSVRCQHQLKLYPIECDRQVLKKRKKLEIIPGALLKEVGY